MTRRPPTTRLFFGMRFPVIALKKNKNIIFIYTTARAVNMEVESKVEENDSSYLSISPPDENVDR